MISWNNDDNNKNSWNSKINDVLTFCVRRNKWDRGWIQCRLDSTMCTSTTSSSCGWWWCSWCSIWHWHFLKKFFKKFIKLISRKKKDFRENIIIFFTLSLSNALVAAECLAAWAVDPSPVTSTEPTVSRTRNTGLVWWGPPALLLGCCWWWYLLNVLKKFVKLISQRKNKNSWNWDATFGCTFLWKWIQMPRVVGREVLQYPEMYRQLVLLFSLPKRLIPLLE